MINSNTIFNWLISTTLLLLICQGTILAQQQYRFTNYDFRHGLPITDISAIAQDSLGYMWFGSAKGIVRFDGYSFETFTNETPNGAAMDGISVSVIMVAADGRVWIGTHGDGIRVYDPALEIFTSFKNNSENLNLFLEKAIFDFHFDPEGNVWVCGAFNEIYKLNDQNEWTIKISNDIIKNGSRSMLQDPEDPYSFYFENRFLYKYNIETDNVIKVDSDLFGWRHMMLDENNTIWGGQYSEKVNSYNLQTSQSRQINIEGKRISALSSKGGYVWLSSLNGGLYTIDPKSLEISTIKPRAFDLWSLPTDLAGAIFHGRDNLAWVGTRDGISLLDPNDQQIKNVPLTIKGTNTFLEPHFVYPFRESSFHLATPYYLGNLIMVDPISKDYTLLEKSHSARNLGSPFKIFMHDNRYHIAFSNGLGILNETTMKVDLFETKSPDNLLEKYLLIDMVIGNQDDVWLADHKKNIFRLHLNTGMVDTFSIKGPIDYYNPACLRFNDGDLWLSGANGIVLFKTEVNKFHYFSKDEYPQFRTGGMDVLVDLEDNLWVSTRRDSLFKFKYSVDSLIQIGGYGISKGLSGKRVGEMTMTENGYIYVSSNSGFSRYDATSDRFVSWTTKDGLLSNSLNNIFSLGNQVFLTTNTGYAHFMNEDLSFNAAAPKTNVVGVTAGAEKRALQNKYNFKSNQNDIVLEYVGLHLSDPNDVMYQYRLNDEGDWTTVDAQSRIVRYSNLNSGDYDFQVRASVDGFNWGKSDQVLFNIAAPIWKRNWFRLLMAFAFGFGIYSFIRWREAQIKSKEETRTRMAELELKALRSQMNPHFMFNSLNSIKNFILKSKPADAAQYLSSFSHLIRMTLQNSRERTIPLRQELDTLMLYIDLEKLRFKKGFEFTCEVDEQIDLDEIQIPPLLLQPYVENAIWHGLMHKEDDAVLSLSFRKMNGTIECIIEDNGVGRERAAELKSSSARKYKSMGMGITKDRIDILNQMSAMGINASIIDKSNNKGEPSGTKVIIALPLEEQPQNGMR